MGTAAAAIAGAIYFMNTDSGKRQGKKLKGWAVRMRGEVMDKLESLEEVTEPIYNQVVDTVADAEALRNNVPKEEIVTLANDLKRQWKTIRGLFPGHTKKAKSKSTNRSKKTSGNKSKSSRSKRNRSR